MWLEAFKLSIDSTDGTPFLMLSESALAKLNDTVTYSTPLDVDISSPVATRGRKKASVGTSGSVPMSNLDLIEQCIAEVSKFIEGKRIEVRPATIALGRRRLMEFVMAGFKMDISKAPVGTTTSKESGSSKTLKTIDAAIAHVRKAIWDVHAASLSLTADAASGNPDSMPKSMVDCVEDDTESCDVQRVAFTLSVPMKVVAELQSDKVCDPIPWEQW